MEEIIYFELDNWFAGENYPNAEPFLTWMKDDLHLKFEDDNWCKENKLCVEAGPIDMSICFCISAPKSWVEANCPKLLTDEECGNYAIYSHFDKDKGEWVEIKKYEPSKYSNFVCQPDEDEEVHGKLSNWPFREYTEENFGVHWNDWWYSESYDDDDDEEDEE